MENKMTAVEWLIENIPDLGKYIPLGVSIELHAKFHQANELFEQQIKDAFQYKFFHPYVENEPEIYYNETYKIK
jgi:hypothetical protein